MSDKINEAISIRLRIRDDIISQIEDKNINKERRYMLKILLRAVQYLYSIGIYTFPEIIYTFQRNHFNGSEFFSNVILKITERIKKELKCDVNWIKSRAVKKGNNKDKKIILCFLLYYYRYYFIIYLHDYLLENKHNKEDIRNLISTLQRYIDDASKSITNFLPSNLNRCRQEKNVENNQKNEFENIIHNNSFDEDNNTNLENDQNNENETIIHNKSFNEDNNTNLENDQNDETDQLNPCDDQYLFDDSISFGQYSDDFESLENSYFETTYW